MVGWHVRGGEECGLVAQHWHLLVSARSAFLSRLSRVDLAMSGVLRWMLGCARMYICMLRVGIWPGTRKWEEEGQGEVGVGVGGILDRRNEVDFSGMRSSSYSSVTAYLVV